MENVKDIKLYEEKYCIQWKNTRFHIENMGGNLNILFENDINIGINGELGIASTDNINIDAIGSKIYLNSRRSKSLKNLPESIEFRKKQEKENEYKQLLMGEEHDSFIERIEKLEQKIKDLENGLNKNNK